MGNGLGGSRKTAKVMKIDGETMKLKTPIQAMEVTKDHPGHVLLDSESVKHYGIRAKPLDPTQNLEPKRLYFLVELPRFPLDHHRVPRRVRSGVIHVSAKDRLETLLLSRRSASDLSIMKPASNSVEVPEEEGGPVRLKVRLPKAEVERLMSQSRNKAEAAEKIMNLYMSTSSGARSSSASSTTTSCTSTRFSDDVVVGSKDKATAVDRSDHQDQQLLQAHKPALRIREGFHHKKRVGFLPINEGEIQLAVA